MSKMLQVRDVPDPVHDELRRRAARAGMSLSGFVLRELERLTARPPVDEVLARAAARGGRLSLLDAAEAVREDRDTRSRQVDDLTGS